jgi:hypothetical protein
MIQRKFFIVKYKSNVFEPNTIVRYDTAINDSYLVVDVNDELKREWLMKTDLYPIDKSLIDNWTWYYNEKFNEIAEEFIRSNC